MEETTRNKRSIHFLLGVHEKVDSKWSPFIRLFTNGLRQEDLPAKPIAGADGLFMVKTDMPVGKEMAMVQMGKIGQWCGDVRQMDMKQYKLDVDKDCLVHITWGQTLIKQVIGPGNKIFFFNECPRLGMISVLGEQLELGYWNPDHVSSQHLFHIRQGLSLTVIDMPRARTSDTVTFKMLRRGATSVEWEKPAEDSKQVMIGSSGEDMAVYHQWCKGQEDVRVTELPPSNEWYKDPQSQLSTSVPSNMFDSDIKSQTQSAPELTKEKDRSVLVAECVHAAKSSTTRPENLTLEALGKLVKNPGHSASKDDAAKVTAHKSVDDYLHEFMTQNRANICAPEKNKKSSAAPIKVCSLNEFVRMESSEELQPVPEADQDEAPVYVHYQPPNVFRLRTDLVGSAAPCKDSKDTNDSRPRYIRREPRKPAVNHAREARMPVAYSTETRRPVCQPFVIRQPVYQLHDVRKQNCQPKDARKAMYELRDARKPTCPSQDARNPMCQVKQAYTKPICEVTGTNMKPVSRPFQPPGTLLSDSSGKISKEQAQRLAEGIWATPYENNSQKKFHYGMSPQPVNQEPKEKAEKKKKQSLKKRIATALQHTFGM